MKSLKVLLLLTFCFIGTINVFSQKKDEITLTVSADGTSKEEAINFALRDALRQAYESFVSTNTTLIDRKVTKQEIVTITNGNIKNYEEIAFNAMPNGKIFVTLKATVCISKLISYAQSEGAEAEFAGATLGMNMKMIELNKKNELTAIEHLMQQLDLMADNYNLFDLDIRIGEPQLSNDGVNYVVGGRINLVYNQNTQNYFDVLYNTLLSLSMSDEEQAEYTKLNVDFYKITIPGINVDIYLRNPIQIFDYMVEKLDKRKTYYVRVNEEKTLGEECKNHLHKNATEKVIIADNISTPTQLEIFTGSVHNNKLRWNIDDTDREAKSKTKVNFLGHNKEVFNGFKIKEKIGKTYIGFSDFTIKIPQNLISKYTGFKAVFKE